MVNMEIFEEQGSVRESSVDRDVPQKKRCRFCTSPMQLFMTDIIFRISDSRKLEAYIGVLNRHVPCGLL
jgi:hypothetical protein